MKYKGVLFIVKPWYWNYIPTLAWTGASAHFDKIILRKDIYEDVTSKNPSPANIALLEHELKHIERQRKVGKWRFWLLYQFSSKFRINEELIADKARFKFIRQNKVEYDLQKRAEMLSSWKYFWGISYVSAKAQLEKLYEEA
jgi:hypothetical protein